MDKEKSKFKIKIKLKIKVTLSPAAQKLKELLDAHDFFYPYIDGAPEAWQRGAHENLEIKRLLPAVGRETFEKMLKDRCKEPELWKSYF